MIICQPPQRLECCVCRPGSHYSVVLPKATCQDGLQRGPCLRIRIDDENYGRTRSRSCHSAANNRAGQYDDASMRLLFVSWSAHFSFDGITPVRAKE
jgi:hypothetical protein